MILLNKFVDPEVFYAVRGFIYCAFYAKNFYIKVAFTLSGKYCTKPAYDIGKRILRGNKKIYYQLNKPADFVLNIGDDDLQISSYDLYWYLSDIKINTYINIYKRYLSK